MYARKNKYTCNHLKNISNEMSLHNKNCRLENEIKNIKFLQFFDWMMTLQIDGSCFYNMTYVWFHGLILHN